MFVTRSAIRILLTTQISAQPMIKLLLMVHVDKHPRLSLVSVPSKVLAPKFGLVIRLIGTTNALGLLFAIAITTRAFEPTAHV